MYVFIPSFSLDLTYSSLSLYIHLSTYLPNYLSIDLFTTSLYLPIHYLSTITEWNLLPSSYLPHSPLNWPPLLRNCWSDIPSTDWVSHLVNQSTLTYLPAYLCIINPCIHLFLFLISIYLPTYLPIYTQVGLGVPPKSNAMLFSRGSPGKMSWPKEWPLPSNHVLMKIRAP